MVSVDSHSEMPSRRDNWVPWAFVAFFLVVFAVNGVFIYLATTSWVGLVTENPYERGLNYNEVLAAKAEQERLGWAHEIAFQQGGTADDKWHGTLSTRLTDKAGLAIEGAVVKAVAERPGRYSQVFAVPLQQHGSGIYTGTVELPLPGQWHVKILAQKGASTYRAAETFFVEPN